MPDRIGELASMEGYSPQEADFQFGVRATPWFGEFAQQHGEPNLNDPNYDYRAAWAAGARPNVRDPSDNQYHWPSQFKGPEHPNRFVNGVDTITGEPLAPPDERGFQPPPSIPAGTGEGYAGLGGDPSHLATTIKNWWTNQPSWLEKAKAENLKTTDAFQRGGMGEIAKQLATDTTEAQDLVSAFGVGNIKGVKPPLAPGALAAISEYRPPFYSAAEQAVQGAKQNVAPGQQWAGFLRNQPGVKPEEVEALKLGKLFEQPSVSKEAMLGEIAANRVNVKDVIKSDKLDMRQYSGKLEAGAQEHFSTNYDNLSENQQAVVRKLALGDQGYSPTKFSQYTLPGGENYREMLLTLPHRNTPKSARMTEIEGLLQERRPGDTAQRAELRVEYKRLADETRADPTFKSSHFDEPNVLAHVRYNDRVIDGKKTLFVEEVQSDWHQAGKRKGYIQPPEPLEDTSGWTAKVEKNNEFTGQRDVRVYDAEGNFRGLRSGTRATDAEIINDFAQSRAAEHPPGQVPDAPFKTTWPELAMKRIIREAAEKGYDKVAWTPGSVQAERYDLSKAVKRVYYLNDTNTLRAQGRNGEIIIDEVIPKEKVADYIGKDAAQKLFETPIKSVWKDSKQDLKGHDLSGLDLQVGGEGMKGFYDEILPATVNKLVKKHGGRVQSGKLSPRSDIDIDTPPTVHTLDITPSLRAQAMKGFPLFSAGGVAATGIMGEMARQDEYQ